LAPGRGENRPSPEKGSRESRLRTPYLLEKRRREPKSRTNERGEVKKKIRREKLRRNLTQRKKLQSSCKFRYVKIRRVVERQT